MNTSTYRQCTLHKGSSVLVNWIPSEFAVLSKSVRLKDDNGNWETGWTITKVGDVILSYEVVLSNSQDYKRTREASDI